MVYLWLLGLSFGFGFYPVLFGVFLPCFGSPLGFVGFSFVVKLNGSGLWVLEKIR